MMKNLLHILNILIVIKGFIPDIVFLNAESYSGHGYIVRCEECNKKVMVQAYRTVNVYGIKKADKDAELTWGV